MPVHRIEIHPRVDQQDPRGDDVRRAAQAWLGWAPSMVRTADVFLIEGELSVMDARRIADRLLADPVTQEAVIGVRPTNGGSTLVEVHPLPGVMDPVGLSAAMTIRDLLGPDSTVRYGLRYDLFGVDRARADELANRLLANTVIQAVHREPQHPASLPHGGAYSLNVIEVPLRDLNDDALMRLSREGHLFLSLDEMKAIQSEYRRLGREPRDIELETLAQTWSEHCVHKTFKSTIRYRGEIPGEIAVDRRPGHTLDPDGSITIHNLLKSTVAEATREMMMEDGGAGDWLLSVFVDNSGVIAFDDDTAVCFKVETHNHPSAIEPYGGAATGIGGCIRDIIGTGLAAAPIASTDVFCVAYPGGFTAENAEIAEKKKEEGREKEVEFGNAKPVELRWADSEASQARSFAPASDSSDSLSSSALSAFSAVNPSARDQKTLPAGCLHPRRILSQVVAGVRDYGNRMGIPTLNGAVYFDDRYVGNPLVFCGCIGVMPRDKVKGAARAGDRIIALGGRTGRDGIHGATFSSAELTDTHADEFSHAVQIGNAITEKKTLDVIIQARDHERGCLFSAITDCGAGGFSSAVGEMGEALGAEVHLDRAPLKYAGLSYTEIWISEAQERMVLAVAADKIDALEELCKIEGVEWCDLGVFGTSNRELILNYAGVEVGRMSMEFLHEGIPTPTREATWTPPSVRVATGAEADPLGGLSAGEALLKLLAHPNIASKHWIIRQYDHEVQGATVAKPLVGVRDDGPSDAAVITPKLNSTRGLAIANGLATGLARDPYIMALAAVDECVRNLVCVGADPERIAILDNFCWPSCNKPENLGALVRAAEGCYDAVKAYRTPFISGKDSLNNQFTTERGETIEIPPTLLISGFGIVRDIRRVVSMDAKRAGDLLIMVGATGDALGGSHLELVRGEPIDERLPKFDLNDGPRIARAVADLIASGVVVAAHDCSEGGLLVAAAEMAFAGGAGLDLDLNELPITESVELVHRLFAESPSRYLLEVTPSDLDVAQAALRTVPHAVIGRFTSDPRLREKHSGVDLELEALRSAWRGTLDW